MRIRKQLYLEGPEHEAVYASAAVCGDRILETVRHEARKPKDSYEGGMGYYSPTIYSRATSDNGRTWQPFDKYSEDPFHFEGFHNYGRSFVYDPEHRVIGGFCCRFHYDPEILHKETFSDAGCYTRTFRIVYSISCDSGATWSDDRPLLCDGYDHRHWGPGLRDGESGAILSGNPCFFNNAIYLALAVNLHDGKKYQSVIARGEWEESRQDWKWTFSDYITLDSTQSSQGACEPAIARCTDNRFIVLLRACGDRENKTFPTYKYFVHSTDDCRHFTEPRVLQYDDGSPVWCPSSYSQIIRSSVNSRYYLITNILAAPTYNSAPRDPLCIAEIIPEDGVVLKGSVEIIDRNNDAVEKRRYTNFGLYEDPESKEFVLTMPEQPKISWEDFTADCYQYRVTI